MKLGYTDITVVLDKSGSMSSLGADTVGSYNAFVESQAKLDGDCTITLVQFATLVEDTYKMQQVKDVKPLVLNESYTPDGGSTSLLDAIGQTISAVGQKYKAMKESERPEKVVFVIQTDGAENSSREFNRKAIFEAITHQKEKYNWEFIFLGANQDAITVGASFGIASTDSLSYGFTSHGLHASAESLSAKVSCYRSTGVMPSFTDQDRATQKAEGAQ